MRSARSSGSAANRSSSRRVLRPPGPGGGGWGRRRRRPRRTPTRRGGRGSPRPRRGPPGDAAPASSSSPHARATAQTRECRRAPRRHVGFKDAIVYALQELPAYIHDTAKPSPHASASYTSPGPGLTTSATTRCSVTRKGAAAPESAPYHGRCCGKSVMARVSAGASQLGASAKSPRGTALRPSRVLWCAARA